MRMMESFSTTKCIHQLLAFLVVSSFCVTTTYSQEGVPSERIVNATNVWEIGYVRDMYSTLECDANTENFQSIHSLETWALLQSTYSSVVDDDTNSLPPGGFVGMDGWYVKYKVEHRQFGRSIVANERIAKGTTVWKSFNTARFSEASQYRSYLRTLPSNLACDVIHWAYTRLDPKGKFLVCVDLDPGSFVNGCESEYACNLVLSENSGRYTGCDLEFVAGRDIEVGEELQVPYSFAEGSNGWVSMNLRSPLEVDEDEFFQAGSVDEDTANMGNPTMNPHQRYLQYLHSLPQGSNMQQEFAARRNTVSLENEKQMPVYTEIDADASDFVEWPSRNQLGDVPPTTRNKDTNDFNNDVEDEDDEDGEYDADDYDDDDDDDDDDEYEFEYDEALAAHMHYQHAQYMQHMQYMEQHRKEQFAGVGKTRAALLAWDAYYENEWDEEEDEELDETIYPAFDDSTANFEPWPEQTVKMNSNDEL